MGQKDTHAHMHTYCNSHNVDEAVVACVINSRQSFINVRNTANIYQLIKSHFMKQVKTLGSTSNNKTSLCVCVSYLEQTRVKQQCVCSFCVVFSTQVKVNQFVKVPAQRQKDRPTDRNSHQSYFNISPLDVIVGQNEDLQRITSFSLSHQPVSLSYTRTST